MDTISRIFLIDEGTLKKRLVRGRSSIRELGICLEPTQEDFSLRLNSVLKVIYLMFSEGSYSQRYKHGMNLEIATEATRLGKVLVDFPETAVPKSHALFAWMMLTSSRFPARHNANGELIDLKLQDRSLWDQKAIDIGERHLALASRGTELSHLHLEAMIARCHATANSFETTDWRTIADLYEQLLLIIPSPIIQLQLAIARGYGEGPFVALELIDKLRGDKKMEKYYLLYATIGEFQRQLGLDKEALENYQHAYGLTNQPAEASMIQAKISELESK